MVHGDCRLVQERLLFVIDKLHPKLPVRQQSPSWKLPHRRLAPRALALSTSSPRRMPTPLPSFVVWHMPRGTYGVYVSWSQERPTPPPSSPAPTAVPTRSQWSARVHSSTHTRGYGPPTHPPTRPPTRPPTHAQSERERGASEGGGGRTTTRLNTQIRAHTHADAHSSRSH